MIFIALGANLPSQLGSPVATLEAVLIELADRPDLTIRARSSWFRTSPVGKMDQPDFINGVIGVECDLTPMGLLKVLLAAEKAVGRERRERWGARVVDLDIIDFDSLVVRLNEGGLTLDLPHPRAHLRGFVLQPLSEIAPDWVHPELQETVHELLAKVPVEQIVEKIEE